MFLYFFLSSCSRVSDGRIAGVASKPYSDELSVAIFVDNDSTFQALVCTKSVIDHADERTKYRFFIMTSEDFDNNFKDEFKKLENDNFRIEFIDMLDPDNSNFFELSKDSAFHKLSVSKFLLKNVKKCVTLDPRTLVFCDLNEVFKQLDLKDIYVAGVPDISNRNAGEEFKNKVGLETLNQCIEGSVLIWNLELCRENAVYQKFFQYAKDHICDVSFCSEDIINAVCYNKIMDLPFKFNFDVSMESEDLDSKDFTNFVFSKQELEEGREKAMIVNFSRNCAWEDLRLRYARNWWQEARTLECFKKIEEKYIFQT